MSRPRISLAPSFSLSHTHTHTHTHTLVIIALITVSPLPAALANPPRFVSYHFSVWLFSLWINIRKEFLLLLLLLGFFSPYVTKFGEEAWVEQEFKSTLSTKAVEWFINRISVFGPSREECKEWTVRRGKKRKLEIVWDKQREKRGIKNMTWVRQKEGSYFIAARVFVLKIEHTNQQKYHQSVHDLTSTAHSRSTVVTFQFVSSKKSMTFMWNCPVWPTEPHRNPVHAVGCALLE